MLWKQYEGQHLGALDKEFWDAYDSDGVSAHVLRLGDKWCAYANKSSKYGDPSITHGGRTDFVFTDRKEAVRAAEELAKQARVSFENEAPPLPEDGE